MPKHVTETVASEISARMNWTTGSAVVSSTATFTTDEILETTTNNGVTIDGVVCRDGGTSTSGKSYVDEIVEYTASAGTSVENVHHLDGGVTIPGKFALLDDQVTVSEGGTGAATFTANGILYGNTTSALQVTAAGTSSQRFTADSTGTPIWQNREEAIEILCVAPATSVTATSDVAMFYYPFAGYIDTTFAGVSIAPQMDAGGVSFTVDVMTNTTSIFTTKLTVDGDETKSTTAHTPAVITTASSAFSKWDLGRIHVHATGTTAPKGLAVVLMCVRTD